jgi:YHS domain-containing protein
MEETKMIRKLAIAAALTSVAIVIGCSEMHTPPPRQTATEPDKPLAGLQSPEHAHKAGAHGGLIAEIGRDNYHAEAIFAKDGIVKIYTLGKDESRVQHVETQTLEAYARAEGEMEDVQVDLFPLRQKMDPPDKVALFRGKLPAELWGKTVTLTVPITVNGEAFRFRIRSKAADGDAHSEESSPMPTRASSAKEKQLYLTPGGKYTADDIAANGSLTASEKFKGIAAKHDRKPQPGDRICPISMTKANPKFTWVINGQAYQFCCPPCVDEFVQLAKEKPDEVAPAASYVKE